MMAKSRELVQIEKDHGKLYNQQNRPIGRFLLKCQIKENYTISFNISTIISLQ